MGQVLVGTGHMELDLVADALLGTPGRGHSRDVEQEAEQQNPQSVWMGLRIHLSGKRNNFRLSPICLSSARL